MALRYRSCQVSTASPTAPRVPIHIIAQQDQMNNSGRELSTDRDFDRASFVDAYAGTPGSKAADQKAEAKRDGVIRLRDTVGDSRNQELGHEGQRCRITGTNPCLQTATGTSGSSLVWCQRVGILEHQRFRGAEAEAGSRRRAKRERSPNRYTYPGTVFLLCFGATCTDREGKIEQNSTGCLPVLGRQ